MRLRACLLLSIGVIALGMPACRHSDRVITPQAPPQTPMPTRTPSPSPTPELAIQPDTGESFTGIYLVDPSDNHLQMLTEPGIHYDYPHFSPDGHYIAFARTEEVSRALMLYDRQTGEMTAVEEDSRLIRALAWSPDSKGIAFSLSNGYLGDATALRVYDLSTGTATTIAEDEGNIGAFPWSPDGRRLAFVLDETPKGSSRLGIYEVRTKHVATIAENDSEAGMLSWSPDGERFAFVLYQTPEGPSELRVYTPDADDMTILVSWEGWISKPSWSPDNRLLAFSGASIREPHQRMNLHRGEVYIVRVEGGKPIRLTSHDGNASEPTWSPTDKSALAYVVDTNPDQYMNVAGDLYLVDPTVSNSQPTRLLKNIYYLGYPNWSPNGEYIAIGCFQGGVLIDMKSLLQSKISSAPADWSRDSDALLFEALGGGISMVAMRTVYWIDIGAPETIHDIASDFLDGKRFWQTNAEWAPDGKSIVFTGRLNAPTPAP